MLLWEGLYGEDELGRHEPLDTGWLWFCCCPLPIGGKDGGGAETEVQVGWLYVSGYCEVGISEGEGSYFDHG